MEPAERISEEWSSLGGFYTAEEADFMTQLLGNYSFPEENINGNSDLGIPSAFWPAYHDSTVVSLTGINDNTSYCSPNVANTNFFCFTQGSNSSSGNNNDIDSIPMSFYLEDVQISAFSNVEGTEHLGQRINENHDEEFGVEPRKEVHDDKNMQVDSESEMPVSELADAGKSGKLKNSAKRSRSSIEALKNKRNVKAKKNAKSSSVSNIEEDGIRSPGLQGQSVSSCSSEDDSNASQDGGASSSLNPQDPKTLGKSRTPKGPATDPQSVYARRRIERINEKLRILQNLVPKGTKVDISIMLEEAVQYVKFLQLQIKLLNSDDLWIYAPIAYNGMNIRLNLDITPIKQ